MDHTSKKFFADVDSKLFLVFSIPWNDTWWKMEKEKADAEL